MCMFGVKKDRIFEYKEIRQWTLTSWNDVKLCVPNRFEEN